MADLNEFVSLYINNLHKDIFYDVKNDEFVAVQRIKLIYAEAGNNRLATPIANKIVENIDDYYPTCQFEDRELNKLFIDFINEHKDKLSSYNFGPNNKIAYTKLYQAIEQENLYDEWADFFLFRISFDFYLWCNFFEINEIETDEETYLEIRDQLEILNKNRYQDKFSTLNLFRIPVGEKDISFVFLGNDKVVEGIAFYLHSDSSIQQQLFGESSPSLLNKDTIISLQDYVAFYFENDKNNRDLESFNSVNPFGKDGDYTSIVKKAGTQLYNLLPDSLGVFFKQMLKYINNSMPQFLNSSKYDEVDPNECSTIYLKNNFFYVFNLGMSLFYDNDYYHYLDELMQKVDNANIYKGTMSFSLRMAPGYYEDDNDPRIIHFAYMGLFVDEDSEKVIYAMNEEIYSHYLEFLSFNIKEEIEKKSIAKTILVNNDFDYIYITKLLEPLLQKKKIKVILEPKILKVDEVFDTFKDEFNQDEDKEEYLN